MLPLHTLSSGRLFLTMITTTIKITTKAAAPTAQPIINGKFDEAGWLVEDEVDEDGEDGETEACAVRSPAARLEPPDVTVTWIESIETIAVTATRFGITVLRIRILLSSDSPEERLKWKVHWRLKLLVSLSSRPPMESWSTVQLRRDSNDVRNC